MPDQYPYIISNNKIEPILRRIRTAAKPDKLSQELLATWGFTASNDRAMPRLLKALSFLNDSGVPLSDYDRLRDPQDWKRVLAEKIRQTYSDLYAMDANMHSANEAEIKGAISRITGKDEETVKRYFSTFKALAALADFNTDSRRDGVSPKLADQSEKAPPADAIPPAHPPAVHRKSEYHYNIQIHLPVTTDISVYNAIFKSLRENLGV